MTIKGVGTVSVFVNNQERAKLFYVSVLGMELRTDAELYPGATNRWIAVAPKGAKTEIILYLPDENWEHYRQVVGKSQAITLEVDNLKKLFDELSKKNVRFLKQPEKAPWGHYAIIEDSEGNSILLVENT